eukprot:CAMPEP_0114263146 /NCGR_PEP_ID=MMETSP0058-20121206/22300_1 /TAXON_ID=36894 /ORGANISM="Pyramimonas parkeae, CCMP726" /LENGTH=175 /DNA_ID=CAMNT_0001379299 /DNA_START=80 /DNA_END=604 /DNA_ORIENTATION=+
MSGAVHPARAPHANRLRVSSSSSKAQSWTQMRASGIRPWLFQVVRMPGSPDLVRTQWRARGPCRVTAQNHEEMLTSGVTKNHSAHTPRDLFEGTEGPEVRQLQQFLVIEGYLPEDSHITGYFGKITEQAVVRWQKDQGIPSTGFWGPLSRGRAAKVMRSWMESDVDDAGFKPAPP